MAGSKVDGTARERILLAAQELFAESGFDATPTSRIAERAGVPKGLVHYYFRRKTDLLVALIERLPDESVERDRVVVPGDVAESLRRLVGQLARGGEGSAPPCQNWRCSPRISPPASPSRGASRRRRHGSDSEPRRSRSPCSSGYDPFAVPKRGRPWRPGG